MPSPLLPTSARPRPARRGLVAALVVVLLVHAGFTAVRRTSHSGDFDVSREFGRRFVAGEALYTGGLHYPYMPVAALFFAPLAIVPSPLAFALRYAAALAALWYVLRRLHQLMSAVDPAQAPRRFALAMLTLGLASHYILRDLDDGGPHLILLAFLVAGVAAVARRREVAAAAWFGLAAALKAPNALLLPLLLWQRQWRLAGLTSVAIAAWIALPLVWMGPAAWWQHQSQWLATAARSAAGMAAGGQRESEARPQNQALRPTLTRLCEQACGGRGCAVAGGFASLALIGAVAWWTRRGWDARDWPSHASAVLIVALLLSPVTWVQHLILLIPALYLIVASPPATLRRDPSTGAAPHSAAGVATLAGLAVYAVLALLLNRELLGRERYLALLAGGLHTWCMLLVLALLIATAPRRVRSVP